MELRVILKCQPYFEHKARYVIDTLLGTLGMRYKVIDDEKEINSPGPVLYYGPLNEAPLYLNSFDNPMILIRQKNAYFKKFRPFNPQQVRYFNWQELKAIPALFYSREFEEGSDGIRKVGRTGHVYVQVDLIAGAFFFLSCWQEYICRVRDKFGRFPVAQSLQEKLGLTLEPIVNLYLRVLKDLLIKATVRAGFIPEFMPLWPDNKKFAVALTHDVDDVQKWHSNAFKREIKCLAKELFRGQPKEFRRRIKVLAGYLAKRQDPYWVYDFIVGEERRRHFNSTFFFLGGQTHLQYEKGFALDKEKVQDLIRSLTDAGAEVGLHGSFSTWHNPVAMTDEFKMLTRLAGKVTGIRQHYLRLDIKKTFDIMESVGFTNDATLGFADGIGFRAAFAYPFFPYNVSDDRPYRILEIPLAVMDASLRTYQSLDAAESKKAVQEVFTKVANCRGAGSLLWHNAYFDELDFPGFGQVYLETLDWLEHEDAWGTSCRGINDWWRQRQAALVSPARL